MTQSLLKPLQTHLRQLQTMIKLKVISVMMFSSLIGIMIVPSTDWTWLKASSGIIGISLAACGSAALNHLFDRNEDKKMRRTKNRPLANDTLCPVTAIIFAISMILLSTSMLIFTTIIYLPP